MPRIVFLICCLFFPISLLAQPDNLEQLRIQTINQIHEVMQTIDGVVGVAAKDLRTGETILLNEALTFPQGSAIKIPILIEVFKQAEAGRFNLDDPLPIAEADQVGGSGVLQWFGDGTSNLSHRDLGVLMIALSDNTATNMLIDAVSMDAVNATLREMGLTTTVLQRKMIRQAASARGDENLSTPLEAIRIMEMLYAQEGLSSEVAEGVLEILKIPKNSSLPSQLPAGVVIANKPGGIGGARCEWGLVYVPRGAYAIAVMSNYVVGNNAGEAFSKISRILYDYYWRLSLATPYGARVPAHLLKQ